MRTFIIMQRTSEYGLEEMRQQSESYSRRYVAQIAVGGGILLTIGAYMVLRGFLSPDDNWHLIDIILGVAAIAGGIGVMYVAVVLLRSVKEPNK